MRIIIDMQGAQAPGSRSRGIGRYSLALVHALIRQRGEHEIVLLLNGAFAEAAAALRAEFGALLPHENIHVWHPAGPVDSLQPDNAWRRNSTELLREAVIATLRPDFVLVTSLFEGLSDDAATSVARLRRGVPTAVILYDLIPLIQRKIYLANPVIENWYQVKLDSLRRADLLLAISASSRQEAIDYLDVAPSACVNISTAADPQFVPLQPTAAREQAMRERYGLTGNFVMYTGGIDHRKNIEGLIGAYGLLAPAVRAHVQLAIVCSVQEQHRIELQGIAAAAGLGDRELVLTGYVSEEDLVLLYNLCTVFVFPSWHEGFGLPALEAMSCGRAVIAAETSSLPEVIGRDDALFNPHDVRDIADKLTHVLTDTGFRQALERHGLERARGFSWDASARRALDAIEAAHQARALPPAAAAPLRRPRLAYVAPLPPERSGIADYSAELLPELSRHYEIEIIAPQGELTDPWVKANCPLRDPDWFRQNAGYFDRVLYHMGNSSFHSHMFELMEEVPGVVVLHDFFLSGVISHLEMTGADPWCWVNALYESHGYPAVAARFGKDSTDTIYAYPCNLRVLRAALNVIVHSDNSRKLARHWYGPSAAADWHLIPHMRVAVPQVDREQARRDLNLAADSFVVCSFGLLGPSKLNDRLLSAWLDSALASDPRCMLVFVGENAGGEYGAALEAAIAASPARQRIVITGWADNALYRRYLAAADAGVQLRTRSRGETSGTVLDCMNYGLATIVNAHGSLADLPGDAVIKLDDTFADADLSGALQRLRDDAGERARLGTRGREIIRHEHGPRHCAHQYALAIEQSYHDGHRGTAGLLAAVAQANSAPADAHDIAAFSQSMAQSLAPTPRFRQRLIEVASATAPADDHAVSMARLLSEHSPEHRVEPVYLGKDMQYRYARRYALELLKAPAHAMQDELVDFYLGDTLLALPGASPEHVEVQDSLRARGVLLATPPSPSKGFQ